ncbi:peptidoglycan-binding protein [Streptomyces sp. NBC_00829]|uniref:peptidoglycan-binding protein n=1 Tax=Streptomyces sp. NBC_00829 TaxID=2903679 RepID=UPI003869BC61|nr:peptidoglycan-binding protein [Streptomyces sp. NBC_00829]
MKRRTGVIAAGVIVVAGVVGAGVPALGGSGAHTDGSGPDLPPSTAEIIRTDLVQSKTVDGTLGFANRRAVKAVGDGTVTVAAHVGNTVRQGQRLYELNDKPVTLLYGQVPMFRDMKTGDRGTDVLQLERNLRDLGYGTGLSVDPRFDAATEAAVKRWQKSLNRTATGKVGKGDVVFQPDRVKIVSADAVLADQVGPDKTVLTVASTTPVIRAQLDIGDTALTRKGTKVEVTLPDGKTVTGSVSGTVSTETSGSDASGQDSDSTQGITVEVTLKGRTQAPADAAGTASVKFISESRKGVLAVPVEAVVALRGKNGGYGLQLVSGTTTTMVRVETGMTTDGQIEVSGPDLREGLKVGVAAS